MPKSRSQKNKQNTHTAALIPQHWALYNVLVLVIFLHLVFFFYKGCVCYSYVNYMHTVH